MMKKLASFLFLLIVNSLVGQNIWEPINFPDSLKSRAINAEKEGIIFVASGGDGEFKGLFKSFNNGNDWELIDVDTTSSYLNIFTIRYNSENVLFIGANSRIYRSFNDGESFEKVFSGASNILRINFSPNGEIYAVGWSYILRSSDGGNTWETLFEGGNMYFGDIDFGLNGEIYAVGVSFDWPNNQSGFHRSLDNGETWENIGITEEYLSDIEVNSDGVLLAGGFNAGYYISTDNGVSWILNSNLLITAIESDSQNNLFAGVNGYYNEGFRFSEDWGNNWTNLNDTILNPYINQISISPDNIIYLQCENYSSQQYQLFKSKGQIVSTSEHEIEQEIKLFPNPANNKLYILTNNIGGIKNILIYNRNGQKIFEQKLTENIIDISALKSGFYIVNLEYENETIRKKIIVK
jgi:photosystem II stability/assembly factor-like uncharacterized protein